MSLSLKEVRLVECKKALEMIPSGKQLINTINAHSYNVAQRDDSFAEALTNGDYLLPDGASIVKACRWLKTSFQPLERISGWDLFAFEMGKLNHRGGVCLFVGSNEKVLERIRQKAKDVFPNIIVFTYSPPYKPTFSDEENAEIISIINTCHPDLLWIGMTAPKQEKWAYEHWEELDINCHVGTIGAVFDFFAGTAQRAPRWMQEHSLEWLYRLTKEPRRMWKRYIIGNPLFVWYIIKEKYRYKNR